MADLLVARDQGIVRITFNRPAQRNAFTPAMVRELVALLGELGRDPELRVVLLSGSGERAFSAGYDLTALEELEREGTRISTPDDPFEQLLAAVDGLPAPIVAVVRGACVGGGCTLAAACDLRIASESARFGMPPARLGLLYSDVGLRPFVELLGPARTRLLFYTGELIDARTAYAIGLVDVLTPDAELEATAERLAAQIAANAPLVVRGTKQILRLMRPPAPAARQEILALVEAALASADFREGRQAFREKRPPRFSGA